MARKSVTSRASSRTQSHKAEKKTSLKAQPAVKRAATKSPAAAPAKGDGSGKGHGSGKETRTATAAQKHIVFPCPNGHKLNGPASLQGQPGQCPHCGAKFRIPVFEPSEQIEGAPQDDGESTHIGEVGEYDLDIEGAAKEAVEEANKKSALEKLLSGVVEVASMATGALALVKGAKAALASIKSASNLAKAGAGVKAVTKSLGRGAMHHGEEVLEGITGGQ